MLSAHVADVLTQPLPALSLSQATFRQILVSSLLICILPVICNRIAKSVTHGSDWTPSVKYGWPIVGNILFYSRDPVTYLRKASAQFGSVFKVNMLFKHTIWLRGHDLNKVYLDTKEVWETGEVHDFLGWIADPDPLAGHMVFWRWHGK